MSAWQVVHLCIHVLAHGLVIWDVNVRPAVLQCARVPFVVPAAEADSPADMPQLHVPTSDQSGTARLAASSAALAVQKGSWKLPHRWVTMSSGEPAASLCFKLLT